MQNAKQNLGKKYHMSWETIQKNTLPEYPPKFSLLRLVRPANLPKKLAWKIELRSLRGINQGMKNLLVDPKSAEVPIPMVAAVQNWSRVWNALRSSFTKVWCRTRKSASKWSGHASLEKREIRKKFNRILTIFFALEKL